MASSSSSRVLAALLSVVAIAVAAMASTDSLATIWRTTDPEATLSLRADDPFALTFIADRYAAQHPLKPSDATMLTDHAQRALRSAPLNAAALRQLAEASALSGDMRRTNALLSLSHKISRRELGTLIWLVQTHLDQGNFPRMMVYADEALTTDPVAAEMLFSALTVGMTDSALRQDLAGFLRRDRPWMPQLLHYALNDREADHEAVARLILAGGGLPHSQAYAKVDRGVLDALAKAGNFALARTYIDQLAPPAGLVSDMRITPRTSSFDLGPFAWSFTDTGDFGARPIGDASVMIRIEPDRRGTLASRLLMLPPGRYSAEGPSGAAGDQPTSKAYWELTCFTGHSYSIIWTQDGSKPAGRTAEFDIAPGCEAQQLDLVAVGGDDIDTALFNIELPRLSRGRAMPAQAAALPR